MLARTGGFLKEVKYVDYEQNIPIATTVVLALANPTVPKCISVMAQGTTHNQRLGNKVLLKSVQIKGIVFPNALADQSDSVRGVHIKLALLMDTQTNGAQYATTDLYEDPSDTALDVVAMRDIEHIERFKVLKEWHMNVSRYSGLTDNVTAGPNSTGSISGDVRYFKCYKKLKIPVRHITTGATIDDVMDNSLHFYAIASEAGWNVKYISRVKFQG